MLNTAQLNAVQRIMPVLAVGSIGSTSQQLASTIAQLVQGQVYQGKVVTRLEGGTFLVNVTGPQVHDLTLKMNLGQQTQLGQTLALEYLHDSPTLTFMLKQPNANVGAETVKLSHTGHLLGQYLQQAEAQGVPKRFEATEVVTQFPSKPALVAQDLKHAVSQSGLFYESHLQAFSQGQTPISQLRQEPQNQSNFTPATMLFQQLAVLENQRLSWQGEVWSGQPMTWDVYEQRLPSERERAANQPTPETVRAIASEMTLDFPNLGKISVKLSLVEGRMRVHMTGEAPPTLTLLQQQKPQLAEAISKNGQTLDGITVARDVT